MYTHTLIISCRHPLTHKHTNNDSAISTSLKAGFDILLVNSFSWFSLVTQLLSNSLVRSSPLCQAFLAPLWHHCSPSHSSAIWKNAARVCSLSPMFVVWLTVVSRGQYSVLWHFYYSLNCLVFQLPYFSSSSTFFNVFKVVGVCGISVCMHGCVWLGIWMQACTHLINIHTWLFPCVCMCSVNLTLS